MAASTVITVLSNIPWGQVVEAAPKVAEGASRLWEAARNFRKPRSPGEAPDRTATPPTETELLKARVAELEGTVQELRVQIQASAEVVKDLANQNALLVQRVELARLRLTRIAIALSGGMLLLAVATASLWITR